MRASSKHEEMNLELAIKTLGVPKKEAGKYVGFEGMYFVKTLLSGGHLKYLDKIQTNLMLAFLKHIQLLRYESLKAWRFGEILSQERNV